MTRWLAALLCATALLAGCTGGFVPGSPALEERWVSDTAGAIQGNHHAVAAGRVGGDGVVAVPLGGHHGEEGCALVVLNGTGARQWHAAIDPQACTIHAVADPTLADYDADGVDEVLAATTENQLVAYAPRSGEVELRFELDDYGYTPPAVANLTGDATPETVVVDVDGTVYVLRPDGSTVWKRPLDGYVWGRPALVDADADGATEIVVGLGDGRVTALERDGSVGWNRSVEGSVTWLSTGDVDGDAAVEVLAATDGGAVVALDGRDGAEQWRRDLGRFAAVGPPRDGDGDGTVEVYATARDGKLRALNGTSGAVEWTTTLTEGDVQMTPPPVVGDLNGDGTVEIVAVTNDGRVVAVGPDGSVLATYERDVSVWTHATLADVDGDGAAEVYVLYGDGSVVSLTYG